MPTLQEAAQDVLMEAAASRLGVVVLSSDVTADLALLQQARARNKEIFGTMEFGISPQAPQSEIWIYRVRAEARPKSLKSPTLNDLGLE